MSAEAVGTDGGVREHETMYTLEVSSPAVGNYVLDGGDPTELAVSGFLLNTPLGRRSLDISQLSTVEAWEAIPRTSRFTRFAHMADLGRLIIALGRKQQLPEENIRALFRNVAVGDAAHGPFSHVSDMAVEGVGAAETFHDGRETEALIKGEAWHWLRNQTSWRTWAAYRYGDNIPPWAECPAPGICVDRLQYNSYEGRLWYMDADDTAATTAYEGLGGSTLMDQLSINEAGEFVFEDADVALLFAKQSLLHGTEHWAHPAKRLQQFLLVGAIQHAIVENCMQRARMITYDWDDTCNPFDALYALDSDIVQTMQGQDEYLQQVHAALTAVGLEQRQQFAHDRHVYASFVTDASANDYPDMRHLAGSATIVCDEAEPWRSLELRSPKYRTLDPLVRTMQGEQLLSDVRPQYKRIQTAHRAQQKQPYNISGLRYEGMIDEDPSTQLGRLVYYTKLARGGFGVQMNRYRRGSHEGLSVFIRQGGCLAVKQATARGLLTAGGNGAFVLHP